MIRTLSSLFSGFLKKDDYDDMRSMVSSKDSIVMIKIREHPQGFLIAVATRFWRNLFEVNFVKTFSIQYCHAGFKRIEAFSISRSKCHNPMLDDKNLC